MRKQNQRISKDFSPDLPSWPHNSVCGRGRNICCRKLAVFSLINQFWLFSACDPHCCTMGKCHAYMVCGFLLLAMFYFLIIIMRKRKRQREAKRERDSHTHPWPQSGRQLFCFSLGIHFTQQWLLKVLWQIQKCFNNSTEEHEFLPGIQLKFRRGHCKLGTPGTVFGRSSHTHTYAHSYNISNASGSGSLICLGDCCH